jgi:hypothetical protein
MPVGETLFDWVVGGRTICDRGEARLYALGEPAERSLTDQGRLTDLPPCRLEKPDNG